MSSLSASFNGIVRDWSNGCLSVTQELVLFRDLAAAET
jgi:hypothetical protein